MPRYIDADALMEELKSFRMTITGIRSGKTYLSEFINEYQKSILKIVDEQPTADVVPKSECDKWYYEYHVIKDELKQEKMYHKETEKLVDKYCVELQTAKSEVEKLEQAGTRLVQENETLKDNNEHLAVMLEEAKSKVERLQAEKDALIKNYAECMKDYASDIFAEVNMQIIPYSTDIYIKGEELIIIPKSDYNAILAKLTKKYTGCEDKPAATEEKYFSPEDVRKMTNQEVREKYIAIRRSMERW